MSPRRALLLPTTLALTIAASAPASDLRPDEGVLLFPTAARLDPADGSWRVPVHPFVFEPEPESAWRSTLIHEIESSLGADPAELAGLQLPAR